MDEAELARLQAGAHAALVAGTYSPKHVLPPDATAVIVATVALVDEVRRLRGRLEACQANRDHYAAVAENALGEVRGLRRRDER